MRIYVFTGLVLPVLTLATSVYSPASAAFWASADGKISCDAVCYHKSAQAARLPPSGNEIFTPNTICSAKSTFWESRGDRCK